MQDQPKRYQCRHIFTDGHRCGSPCLRGEDLCYYHHTTRRPIANPRDRQNRRSEFNLALPEDQSAIQLSIGQVIQRIAANQIDPRRAGLLLYGLQIASLNLPKPETHRNQRQRKSREAEIVEEITTHPHLGTLAPITGLNDPAANPNSAFSLLLAEMTRVKQETQSPATSPQTPGQTTPSIQLKPTAPKMPSFRP
jgi:hypothetical protein